MENKTTNYEVELVEGFKRQGMSDYAIKDVLAPAIQARVDLEAKKYEIDKKVEAGVYNNSYERLNKWLTFTQDFLKDSRLQKFFVALLFAITFLITSGRIITYHMEKLYIENKVHPLQKVNP